MSDSKDIDVGGDFLSHSFFTSEEPTMIVPAERMRIASALYRIQRQELEARRGQETPVDVVEGAPVDPWEDPSEAETVVALRPDAPVVRAPELRAEEMFDLDDMDTWDVDPADDGT